MRLRSDQKGEGGFILSKRSFVRRKRGFCITITIKRFGECKSLPRNICTAARLRGAIYFHFLQLWSPRGWMGSLNRGSPPWRFARMNTMSKEKKPSCFESHSRRQSTAHHAFNSGYLIRKTISAAHSPVEHQK